MNPVTVGIVGLGNMGRNHLRVLGRLGTSGGGAFKPNEIQVWGAADPSDFVKGWVEQYAEGLPLYSSLEEMLAGGAGGSQWDAIIVASPTADHYRSARLALEAGCSVLVEKPFAANLPQAMELTYDIDHKQLLMVGLIERFNPVVESAKAFLAADDGRIKPVLFDARRSGLTNLHPANGVAAELATHDVDVINYLVGGYPIRANGQTGAYDGRDYESVFAGTMWYPNGVVGSVAADWLSPEKVRELRIVCEEGTLHLDYIKQELTWHPIGFEPQAVEVRKGEPLEAELVYFLHRVQFGEPDEMNLPIAALNTMQLIERMKG